MPTAALANTVDTNPWMVCAIMLALRILLPGVCWSGLFHRPPEDPADGLRLRARSVALVLLLGTVLAAGHALFLGCIGLFDSPVADWASLAAFSLLGLALGMRRRPALRSELLARTAWSGILLVPAFVLIMLLPQRGEWILGGWDPGVYMNQGIALARSGSFSPPDVFFHEVLTPEEQALFTREVSNREERFPGVLVDRDRGGFSFQFLRLTPSFIGILQRCGGIRAATRVNHFLGLVALLVFFGAAWSPGKIVHALCVVCLLAIQPIFLSHAHVPVTEMMHLLLLGGVLLILPERNRTVIHAALLALLFFTAMLNRFSFLPFGAMLVVILAWIDMERPDRVRGFGERILQIAGLAAGALLDAYLSPVSVGGWTVLPKLLRITMLFLAAAVVIDALGINYHLRKRLSSLPFWTSCASCAAGIGIFAALYLLGRFRAVTDEQDNFFKLVTYLGPAVVLVAVPGGFFLFCGERKADRTTRGFVLFLLGAVLILCIKKHIRDLYPWANRRFLPYAVPAAALLAGQTLAHLWQSKRRQIAARLGAGALLGLILGCSAHLSWDAWMRTEYDGVSHALARVAAQIDDGDVVVADHPWWGTPLALVHERTVLDGKRMWAKKNRQHVPDMLAALQRIHDEGYAIRFLTSTDEAMDVYPVHLCVNEDWSSGPVSFKELVQHARKRDFEVRDKNKIFRLYTWTPAVQDSE